MDQITILMAVYNPDKEWFKEQLSSLNQQTYPKVKLLICNDASPDISEKELEELKLVRRPEVVERIKIARSYINMLIIFSGN